MGVPSRWPRGPGSAAVPYLALGGMILGCTTAWWPVSRDWPVFKQTFDLSAAIFGGIGGVQLLYGAALVVHALESLFTLRICSLRQLSTGDTLSWMGLTVLLGYPAIHELKMRLAEEKAA